MADYGPKEQACTLLDFLAREGYLHVPTPCCNHANFVLQGSAGDEPNSESASYSLSKKSPFRGKSRCHLFDKREIQQKLTASLMGQKADTADGRTPPANL